MPTVYNPPTYIIPPTGVKASQGTSGVKINIGWNAVSGAAYYFIHRADSVNGVYTKIGYVKAPVVTAYNSTTYPANHVITPGTHYFYKITVDDIYANVSEYSDYAEGWAEVAVPLSIPTGVTASGGIYSYILIEWSAVLGAVSYNVYVKEGTGYNKINTAPVILTSVQITPNDYLDYTYVVTSVDLSGIESYYSSGATGYRKRSRFKIRNDSSSWLTVLNIDYLPVGFSDAYPNFAGIINLYGTGNYLPAAFIEIWYLAPNVYMDFQAGDVYSGMCKGDDKYFGANEIWTLSVKDTSCNFSQGDL